MAVTYTRKDQSKTISTGTGAPSHSAIAGDEYTDLTSGSHYIYTTSWKELPTSAGGLTYFTETGSTVTPNTTVPVVTLIAKSGATNVDFAIVPKGTGALIAAVPDGLTSSGNKRGQYAVDWQMIRNANTRVASGNRSVIIGGYNNGATNTYSIVGGESNQSLGYASVVFGANNSAFDTTGVALGNGNNINGLSSVGLGESNTIAAGRNYAFAAGGLNSIISAGGYQTALGYSNTVSNNVSVGIGYQNTSSGAAGVALGQQNTSSGANSATIGRSNISSAADAVCLGYGNNNAGTFSSVALGYQNTITSAGSLAFAVGQQNNVSGQAMAIGFINNASNGIAIGNTNTASGGGFALGETNTSSGKNSIVTGRQGSSFGVKARLVHSAGQMGALGDSQISKFILQSRTTGATATTLIINYGDSITPFSTNQLILQNNSAYGFTGVIVAKQSASTNAAMWRFNGLIVRGANAASTTLVMSEIIPVSNAPGWGGPSFAADTTYGGLQVQVVGAALTNLQWTANIETTEVIYA